MALKFTSLAVLLQTRGDRGDSGDTTGRANAHAGLAVPTAFMLAAPLTCVGGEPSPLKGAGGDAKSQWPCGFADRDPTDPTVPTVATPLPAQTQKAPASGGHDVWGQAANDGKLEPWAAGDGAPGTSDGGTVLDADELAAWPWLDDTHSECVAGAFAAPAPEPHALPRPEASLAWKEAAGAYHAHHFSCATCTAAGRGLAYGERCDPGLSLWRAYEVYAAPLTVDGESLPDQSSNQLLSEPCHDH